jgi:DNA-binding beta-propeller fold protein YncE
MENNSASAIKPIDISSIPSLLLFIFIITNVIGCTTPREPPSTSGQKEWPAPPAKSRYRYIMTIINSDNIRVKNNKEKLQEALSGKQKPAYSLRRPIEITVKNGRIYLVDSTSSVIHVLDLPRKRYFNFGFRFEGKLGQPVSIATDQQGLVYVSDRARKAVLVYDPFGLYVKTIDLSDIASQLAGIATSPDGEKIYVVDRGGIDSNRHRLLIIDQVNDTIKQIGRRGKGPGQFNLPTDIAVGGDGTVYLLDAGNFRVQVFDKGGEYLSEWGKAGTGLGQFGMPRSIVIDNDNHLYISDAQFGNVQIFSNSGQLLLAVGRLASEPGPGIYSLITGIAVDETNHLYILDQFYKKLDIFRKLEIE